ncbi:MAG: excinuclease ABC subunit UvrC [Candidatus Andersenbacteria bacterium]|nr:excinuclease ABC subunit UvrC [bacterium]MDZ4225352.1 excinuclease ABC subunit UvrC [Candidatus Andersenbacteria bacterium]
MPAITQQLSSLPQSPGVYLFKDQRGSVLYVGKAKRLRSRVRSYFRPGNQQLDPSKQQMVPRICTIETVICDSEHEALLLEANLIRQYQPPYNVILTDDKFYLFIKITHESYPRVFPVRRITNDGSRYFGPYSSARSVRDTLKFLRRLFPYRTANNSPNDKIFPHPLFNNSRKTTNYKILNTEYSKNIENIIRFLKGDRQQTIDTLRAGMKQASSDQAFERAAAFRNQLQSLERLKDNQKVFLPRPESFDVISIATAAGHSAANVFSLRQGKLINKNTFVLKHRADTPAVDILRQFILQYYRDAQDIPPQILIPFELKDKISLSRWIIYQKKRNARQKLEIGNCLAGHSSRATAGKLEIDFHVPRRGRKKKLLEMGETNARQMLAAQHAEFSSVLHTRQATEELFKVIGASPTQTTNNHSSNPRLKLMPRNQKPGWRVEIYDISNIQGQLATGSLVVFIDGQPTPNQYRKFRLKLTGLPNDYAMLREILTRRLRRLTNKDQAGNWPSPDLIIVDGGRGQLSAAQTAMTDLNINHIPVIALAKRHEAIYLPDKKDPLILPYDSDALYLIQRMRDEAHRFTISYHRLLRSKKSSRSLLDEIPELGPKTKQKLLRRFGSLKAIRAADTKELAKVIGKSKAKIIKEYL